MAADVHVRKDTKKNSARQIVEESENGRDGTGNETENERNCKRGRQSGQTRDTIQRVHTGNATEGELEKET